MSHLKRFSFTFPEDQQKQFDFKKLYGGSLMTMPDRAKNGSKQKQIDKTDDNNG